MRKTQSEFSRDGKTDIKEKDKSEPKQEVPPSKPKSKWLTNDSLEKKKTQKTTSNEPSVDKTITECKKYVFWLIFR